MTRALVSWTIQKPFCPRNIHPSKCHVILFRHAFQRIHLSFQKTSVLVHASENVIVDQVVETDEMEAIDEKIWRSVPKPLITIGKQGVQKSHCTLLKDVIANHNLVKVKILPIPEIETIVQKLTESGEIRHLRTKGNTVLFASGNSKQLKDIGMALDRLNPTEIQQWADAETTKLESFHQRRQQERDLRKMSPSDIRLPKSVNLALKSMEDRRMICSLTFDTKTKAMLSRLPEKSQLEILNSITKKEFSRVRNKSAWLTSRIKVHQQTLEQNSI